MKKLLNWFCVAVLAGLLLGMGIYILILQDKCQRLQNGYLQQALTHVGYIYVQKLNKYKADHGMYPDSLEVLFPDYIGQRNLVNIYAEQIYYLQNHTTEQQREQIRQMNVPKCDWWDGWEYSSDPNTGSFELYIIYKDIGSENTMEYVPSQDDFFIGTSVTMFELSRNIVKSL